MSSFQQQDPNPCGPSAAALPIKPSVIPCQSHKDALHLRISLRGFPEKEQMPLIFPTMEGRNSFNVVCLHHGQGQNYLHDPRLAPSQPKKKKNQYLCEPRLNFTLRYAEQRSLSKERHQDCEKCQVRFFPPEKSNFLMLFGVTGPFNDPVTQIVALCCSPLPGPCHAISALLQHPRLGAFSCAPASDNNPWKTHEHHSCSSLIPGSTC